MKPNPVPPSFAALIGNHEPLRVPLSFEAWTAFEPERLESESLQPSADADAYSVIIGRPSIHDTLTVAAKLMHRFPASFAQAAAGLSPEAWRWLYYRGNFILGSLSCPRFHADQELRRLCDAADPFEEPPAEWTGVSYSHERLHEETSLSLRYLGSGPAMAAWCVLSVAQRLGLNKREVRECSWWDPRYINHLALYFALAR